MTLISRIEDELKAARLARDEDRRDALSLLLNSLQSAQKELQRPLSDDEELQVLQRERKRRVEAAEAFRAGGREEQAEDEEYELEVLAEFMPEQMSEAEIEEIIDDVISEVGATNIRDMGRVMAGVMHQASGRADGSVVSQLVKEKLAYGADLPPVRGGVPRGQEAGRHYEARDHAPPPGRRHGSARRFARSPRDRAVRGRQVRLSRQVTSLH